MNWNSKQNKNLINAFLTLQSQDETRRFLRDLMTEGEIEEFSRRLQAAEMLTKNTPYSIIEEETGLSSTTVARVSKWLNTGENGYQTILKKLNHHQSRQPRRGLS